MELSDQRQAFVGYYCGEAYFNATKAASLAGYKVPNVKGSQLKADPEIAQAIKERLDSLALSAAECLALLRAQATATIEDFLDFGEENPDFPNALQGRVRIDLRKARKAGKLHLLKSVKEDDEGGIKIEMYDAQASLVQIGKHHKLFTEKQEITGESGGPVTIKVIQGVTMEDL